MGDISKSFLRVYRTLAIDATKLWQLPDMLADRDE